jgi:hypothetical protein
VIRAEPDWRLLPPATPRRVEALVRRCLKKGERQRLQAIGDARIELDEILSGEAEPQTTKALPQGPRWKTWVAGGLAGLAIALTTWLVTWNLKPEPTPRREVSRQTIPLPTGRQLASRDHPILALAPTTDTSHMSPLKRGSPNDRFTSGRSERSARSCTRQCRGRHAFLL